MILNPGEGKELRQQKASTMKFLKKSVHSQDVCGCQNLPTVDSETIERIYGPSKKQLTVVTVVTTSEFTMVKDLM
ncbi:hypothetical protein LENED_006220 [Lentinula edodes]|uniref:Uncharacterized protein n=1 Tax=Lentinula edodes TaxID=5353 RepID=A0A1Q3EBA5_LENED|nr:hypothetical protein LENED_006220 [Lentinula edodes]